MKASICNNRGAVYVGIIFILLTVLLLSTSLLNMSIDSMGMVINSNNDSYRANYIIESILELKIEEIMELFDGAIRNYMADLQTYKVEHSEDIDGFSYGLPDFYSYIRGLDSDITGLSESAKNHFGEYKEKHYYKVDIKCDWDKKRVNITSRGEYKQARKFINVELELPTVTNEGEDENGLPKIAILPARITRYYQTYGL